MFNVAMLGNLAVQSWLECPLLLCTLCQACGIFVR